MKYIYYVGDYCGSETCPLSWIWHGAYTTLEKALDKIYTPTMFIVKWELDYDEPEDIVDWKDWEFWYPKIEEMPEGF